MVRWHVAEMDIHLEICNSVHTESVFSVYYIHL